MLTTPRVTSAGAEEVGGVGEQVEPEPHQPVGAELQEDAARITDPAVGASVWASGNHVCTGNSGTLTAVGEGEGQKIHRAAAQSSGLALDESSTTVRVFGDLDQVEAERHALPQGVDLVLLFGAGIALGLRQDLLGRGPVLVLDCAACR